MPSARVAGTQFECWLSFQKCTPFGLYAAPLNERRCEIICQLNATELAKAQCVIGLEGVTCY